MKLTFFFLALIAGMSLTAQAQETKNNVMSMPPGSTSVNTKEPTVFSVPIKSNVKNTEPNTQKMPAVKSVNVETPKANVAPAPAAISMEKLTPAQSKAIAETTYKSLNCLKLGDFYWEIGNGQGTIAAGIRGHEFGPKTSMPIASASKWVFGAYALEKISSIEKRAFTAEDYAHLSMRAGYGERQGMYCLLAKSIGDCADKLSETKKEPYKGYFFYSSGHAQTFATELGLTDFTASQMTEEYKKFLGDDLEFTFKTMLVEGGLETTPETYAKFLRKILSGRLRMHFYLGRDAVCTSPYICRTAIYSPAPDEWLYSYQHWVETGRYDDGSFSSPGRFGFYPWISADKKHYGIIARHDRAREAPFESQACALDMRNAWRTGEIQQ